MLVRFVSSETGEVLMYANVAKVLMQAMGKETTARGAFLPAQMLPAAQALRDVWRARKCGSRLRKKRPKRKGRRRSRWSHCASAPGR